jgi:hypothetical protein
MQPDVIEYASPRTPRRRIDWLRLGLAPFFAVLCAAFAWLKSGMYHDVGHLPQEQFGTLLFVGLSLPCLGVTFFLFGRYMSGGRTKIAFMSGVILLVLTLDAVALWKLHTAIGFRLL